MNNQNKGFSFKIRWHLAIVPAEVLAFVTLASAVLLAAIGGSLWSFSPIISVLCIIFSILDGIYGAFAVIGCLYD